MTASGMTARVPGTVDVGSVILGKYRVERVLGTGGMGVVLEATHLELYDRVAIKLLHPQFVMDGSVVSRFLREARAAVKIRSEYVCRVLDVGRLEDGAPYLVMEYLDGTDLKDIVVDGASLPVAEAVDYIMQACMALAHAHREGIVHRDIKPANLFLAVQPDGSTILKVLDFGISKLTGSSVDLLTTNTHTILGTPFYMAPEQLRAARYAEARSDIYSLGVVLYELLTGTLPFEGESLAELSVAVLTRELESPAVRRPDLPPGLAEVVVRSLEKDLARRIGSAAELAALLAPFGPPGSLMLSEKITRLSEYESPAAPLVAARLSSSPGRTSSGSMPRASRSSDATAAVDSAPILSSSPPTTPSSPIPSTPISLSPSQSSPSLLVSPPSTRSTPTAPSPAPQGSSSSPSLRASTPSAPSALGTNTIAESRAFEATAAVASSSTGSGELSVIPISVRDPKRSSKRVSVAGVAVLAAVVGAGIAVALWRRPAPVVTTDPSATLVATTPPSAPPTVATVVEVPSAVVPPRPATATAPTASVPTARLQPVRTGKPPVIVTPPTAAPPASTHTPPIVTPAPSGSSAPRITTDRHG